MNKNINYAVFYFYFKMHWRSVSKFLFISGGKWFINILFELMTFLWIGIFGWFLGFTYMNWFFWSLLGLFKKIQEPDECKHLHWTAIHCAESRSFVDGFFVLIMIQSILVKLHDRFWMRCLFGLKKFIFQSYSRQFLFQSYFQ